jgi:hypothetical protein
MIWEAILTLPAGSDVWLISRDGGFFDKDGLLLELVDEARKRKINVQGHKSLEPLLQKLRANASDLDLAAADIALKTQNPPEVEAADLIPPVEPIISKDRAGRPSGQELERALQRVQATFEKVDARVLGFIAYLETASKDQIFALLNQAGLTTDVARNSAERLAHGGAVRDTGTHYIVQDRALASVAASRVEIEIISLLDEGNRDGH